MAWSKEQDARDQAAQLAWVESWPGWESVLEHPGLSHGWNALHQQHGGGFPNEEPVWSDIPVRFWDTPPAAGPEAPMGFNADGTAAEW